MISKNPRQHKQINSPTSINEYKRQKQQFTKINNNQYKQSSYFYQLNSSDKQNSYQDKVMKELEEQYDQISNFNVKENKQQIKSTKTHISKLKTLFNPNQENFKLPLKSQSNYEGGFYGNIGIVRQNEHKKYLNQTNPQFISEKSKSQNQRFSNQRSPNFQYHIKKKKKNIHFQIYPNQGNDLLPINSKNRISTMSNNLHINLKNSQKYQNNKQSGNSDQNHPIFRDTLQYVDALKYDLSNKFGQYSRISRKTQSSSESSFAVHTNVDDNYSYKIKYKKYKIKYIKSAQVIKQLSSLNDSLIANQRENCLFYENTIIKLQNIILQRDREIRQLTDTLLTLQNQIRSKNICSLEGREFEILQNQNQRLKKEIEMKNKQIKMLENNQIKKNLHNLNESFQAPDNIQKKLQKKIILINKDKQVLIKRYNALQQMNQIYEQKLRDKQKRVSNLSSFNSQLQQEIIKLKSQLHSQIKNINHFDNQMLANIYQKTFTEKQDLKNKLFESKTKQIKSNQSNLQKHLECIDEQIKLIRQQVSLKKAEKDSNRDEQNDLKLNKKLRETQQNSIEEERVQQLKSVLEKLSSFRQTIDFLE